MKSSENRNITPAPATSPEMLRWTFLVYDSLTTDDDVVLFVKGLNNRQGINRESNSIQEVFRCNRPDPTVFEGERISVSLETILHVPVIVPSMAYYTRPQKLESNEKSEKARVCACTMMYNVGNDDDLNNVVDELVRDGYDVKTHSWVWPKTQEAGFSHSAIYAKDSCSWMMYIDVDEFNVQDLSLDKRQIGEITISCYEFGPSNKKSHPIMGVTQGYNCRRKVENIHKSIVLLDVVDHSLRNVIHHFILKQGYKIKKSECP
ncbi:hypothetical protein H5410_063368 [Solanum commersonii]|uniref:Glycosyltransferase family 92 protein n=1 Tax=Solanum commersonii TaxID=4109 RepID=A0A9J5WDB8_SOLCO|nr:hypothetical protein H5410_063368 [Solanum commersonii]